MQEQLESLLYDYDKTVLFVGIGNVLLSDDGVGVYISQQLKEKSTEIYPVSYIPNLESLKN